MPDVTGLRPGDPSRIAHYTVRGRLGSGGQGVVYLAEAPGGRKVAIKQILTGRQDERAHQQLVKEVTAARRVAPFCTARVLDADLESASPYVVSEYIEGPSLQQRIQRGGPMNGAELRWIAIGTATALAAIHQAGVVHRDFKPANVMLAADGPRVIDFGIARDLSTETTVTSRVFGTPAYMAPEQLRGERIGPATDVFAWASVIAYAATGRAPFEAEHMMAVVYRITSQPPTLTGVPADVLGVLQQCLAKDPAARPTAQQVVALLLGRPVPARDPADATQVLAEAATQVHQAIAPAPTVRQQSAAPPPTRRYAPVPPAAASPTPPYPGQPLAGSRPPQGGQPPYSGRPPSFGGQPPYPNQPPANRPQPTTRNHNPAKALLVVAGALVLAVVGWSIGHTLSSAGDDDATASSPATTSDQRPAATITTPPTTPAPAPTTTTEAPTATASASTDPGTIPDGFDGTWTGTGFQPRGTVTSWSVEIDLAAGDSTGSLDLPDLDCEGTLTVTDATARKLTMDDQVEDDGDGTCADSATVELTLLGRNRAAFTWQDASDSQDTATGVLTRQ